MSRPTPAEQIITAWEMCNPCCTAHAGKVQTIWGKERAELILRIDAAILAERHFAARVADAYAIGRDAAAADARRDHDKDTEFALKAEAQLARDIAMAIRARNSKLAGDPADPSSRP